MEPPVTQTIANACAVLCVAAVLLAVALRHRLEPSRPKLSALLGGFAVNAACLLAISAYLANPFSSARAALLLVMLALSPWPWMLAALATNSGGARKAAADWSALIAGAALWCAGVATAAGINGIDWVTGIGSQPTTLLTSWGTLAVATAAAGLAAAVALLALSLWRASSVHPAQLSGAIGAACASAWVAFEILAVGYLTPNRLPMVVALNTTATLIWLIGVAGETDRAELRAPSRRLVYGIVGSCLVLAYGVAAGLALRMATQVQEQLVPIVLPAATFACVAGLFVVAGSRRLRYRVWSWVGRQFFRGKHDYGQVWIRLTDLISQARDAHDLIDGTIEFCSNELGLAEVRVWMTDSGGRLCPSPTESIEGGDATDDQPPPELVPELLAEGAPATTLRSHSGTEIAYACPMRVNGRLLGVLTLGSPRTRVVLDDEDRDVLRHVAAQIGSALELHRLGQEIADGREMSSFHRLSTFVIHDLKNLVAQQSFVLENAEKYGGDPSFVEDALAAFCDSTDRMRGLINRLRERGKVDEVSNDQSDLVQVIRDLVATPHVTLPPGCAIRVDLPDDEHKCVVGLERSALAEVVTNLIGNAVESLPSDGGEITVMLSQERDHCGLRIADNGCGIPEDYLREHLFRPFHTTKTAGMGIGLYQCKALVEASGGTIDLRSSQGHGTTVSLTLPKVPPHQPPEIAECA